MDLSAIVKKLSEAAGVSGFEGPVREILRELWQPWVDELREDAMGNLIALRRGQPAAGAPRRSIMIAAHCDEIGLMVTGIDQGFLRITSVGGVDVRVLPGLEVTVHGRQPLIGVIGMRPPHVVPEAERRKSLPIQDLFVDVGLTQAEATALVRVGDPISWRVKAVELAGERVAGKAMDDRASVTALSEALWQLQALHHEWDVYAVATAQEEVGLRGAVVSAYGLTPDIAIAVDVTFAEGPGLPEDSTFHMDGGPVIGIGPNVHPGMHAGMVKAARDLEMCYQIEPLPDGSGTDGWVIQVCREGVPTGILGIPLGNMHTPVEVACVSDIRRCGRLLAAFIGKLDEPFAAGLIFPLPASGDIEPKGDAHDA